MPRKKKSQETKVDPKSKSKETSKVGNEPVTLSEGERQLIANRRNRLKNAPLKSSALAAYMNGKLGEEEELLTLAKFAEATGSHDYGVQMMFYDQTVKTFDDPRTPEGEVTKEAQIKTIDNALALLHGIGPQNEMEGMLAAQMVGVHNMAMDAMRRATIHDQYPEAKERYTNQAVKLLRTFTAQVEALDKHRRNGHQKVIVEHVHVHEGGQAIVGSVNQGGGGDR